MEDASVRERSRIINSMKRLRRSVQIDLDTVAYWNAHVRKPDEEPIEPDPFGEMRRLLACLDRVIDNDPGHGPIAALGFERSH